MWVHNYGEFHCLTLGNPQKVVLQTRICIMQLVSHIVIANIKKQKNK